MHVRVLAALAQAAPKHRKSASDLNMRTAFAHASIVRAAGSVGRAWAVAREAWFRSAEGTLKTVGGVGGAGRGF